jgi:bifunctional non-homologous end joining protein LigD
VNNEATVLHNNRAGSDKIYRVELREVQGGWVVSYRNGRRLPGPGYQIQGSAGGLKTPTPVTVEQARQVYNAVIREKERGHYRVVDRISEASAIPATATASDEAAAPPNEAEQKDSGKFPMLLIPIEDEATALRLCENPSYCGQEKQDGERRMLLKDLHSIRGVNRNGEFVSIPEAVRAAADSIGVNAFLIDGEEIGETLPVWDLLEYDGEDLRTQPMQIRYERLAMFIPRFHNSAIRIVPTAFTREAKRAMFEDIKSRGGEGMVFKLVAAPYVEGKSKYALKYKFRGRATVQVVGISSTKRSVQMGVAAEDGIQFIGNITIPANKDVPVIGQYVEVEYLYAYPNGGSLYQPTYIGPRPDKNEADRHDSLKFKRTSETDTDDESAEAA